MKYSVFYSLRFYVGLCVLAVSQANAEIEYDEVFSTGHRQHASRLMLNRDGYLYGVSIGGKTGGGIVFRQSLNGKRTIIHKFSGPKSNPAVNKGGAFPRDRLVAGEDGSIYGTTWTGGLFSGGVLFRISWDGKFSILYEFPEALFSEKWSLLRTREGDFYGTISSAGEPHPDGAIYRVDKTGELSIAFDFANDEYSYAGSLGPLSRPLNPAMLFEASDGHLYGGTFSFRIGVASGAVYRLDYDGHATVLAKSEPSDGFPKHLLERADGRLMGADDKGVFEVLDDGTFGRLHMAENVCVLTLASDGKVYGTQVTGPILGATLFSIDGENEVSTLFTYPGEVMYQYAHDLIQVREDQFFGQFGSLTDQRFFRLSVPGIGSANIPPMARQDEFPLKKVFARKYIKEGPHQVPIDVLGNDADADGDALTVTGITQPGHGTASIEEGTNRIIYTPTININTVGGMTGSNADEFTYTISDGKGGEASAKVLIHPDINGTYEGALEGSPHQLTARLSITPKKRVSGRIEIDGKSYLVRGDLNMYGRMVDRIDHAGEVYTVNIKASPISDHWYVTATVKTGSDIYEGSFQSKQYIKEQLKKFQNTPQ